MEVHAHTHTSDPDSHRGRKKWTHYFWEFLMLFLAVFCGFLAEYQLEHKIEKEKAKQYIRSFYEDLKSDTAEVSALIRVYNEKLNVFKNKKECFDSMPAQVKLFNPCILDFFIQASGFPDLVNEDRTILQLKNAGGLRLLKQEDADSILAYDRLVRRYIKNETTGLQELQYRVRELIRSMTNYKNLSLAKEEPSVPLLYTGDMGAINKFFVIIDEYDVTCRSMNKWLNRINKKAIDQMAYFKSKYNLE